MAHLSEHDLWGPGNNRVVALPPSPGDLFVVTTMGGKRALLHPIGEYDKAVSIANAFIRRWRGKPHATIKVLPLTLREAQALGFLPDDDVLRDHTAEEEADSRSLVIHTCFDVLRHSNEAEVRAEALRLLKESGIVQ